MSFKDQLAADAVNIFLNANEFAEEITYTPKGESAKTIKAIVDRKRSDAADQGLGRIAQNQAEISIANDATNGVASVDKGDDEVSFPEVIGGPVISWSVIDILAMDEGMWRLLVEK